MGVSTRIVLIAPDRETAVQAATAGFERIAQIEQVASDYRPSSEVMRLCRGELQLGGSEASSEWTPTSRDLAELLRRASLISSASGGAFDVTVGHSSVLWRQARQSGRLPTVLEQEHALLQTNWRKVEVALKSESVRIVGEGIRIDLGGIAKGYAAHEAARTISHAGLSRCLVSLGGDISAGDPPLGADGWVIQVETEKSGTPLGRLMIRNSSVSTSGDNEQTVLVEGKRYSHIVDPRTGLGALDGATVTVVGRDGAVVDAVATAASLLHTDSAEMNKLAQLGVTIVIHGQGQARIIGDSSRVRWAEASD